MKEVNKNLWKPGENNLYDRNILKIYNTNMDAAVFNNNVIMLQTSTVIIHIEKMKKKRYIYKGALDTGSQLMSVAKKLLRILGWKRQFIS